MSAAAPIDSEAALWGRIFDPQRGDLTPAVARQLLRFTFGAADAARMNELAAKNGEGRLSAAEREDLARYVKVGDVLSLLHLKARRSLARPTTRGANGDG